MTERALNANRDQAALVEETGQSDHGVRTQQRDGHGGIVEVHFPALQGADRGTRQALDIHLEPGLERCLRAQARAEPAVRGAREGLVKSERAAPEIFVTESGVAEDVPPFAELLQRVQVRREVGEVTCGGGYRDRDGQTGQSGRGQQANHVNIPLSFFRE